MSTTAQLKYWVARHRPLRNTSTFLGVFASDQLPDPESVAARAPAALVGNYDRHTLPGSHWCSILITRRKVCWFDSYGLPPDTPDLLLGHETHFRGWLSDVCRPLGLTYFDANHADLQSLGENTCGHWAVFFLKHGRKKWWGQFGPDLVANDALIRRLVRLT